MNRFENQTAIVTGGTSGLGLSIARRLLSEGAYVVVWDTNSKACAELAKEFGTRGSCWPVDITNEIQVKAAVDQVTELTKIHILVNCAGVTGKTNIKSHEVTLDDFDFVLRVNLTGSFLTA